jgi:hypothetical protein
MVNFVALLRSGRDFVRLGKEAFDFAEKEKERKLTSNTSTKSDIGLGLHGEDQFSSWKRQKRTFPKEAMRGRVAHTSNPGYSGGRDQGDHGSSQPRQIFKGPYLKNTLHKKGFVEWLKM